MTLPLSLTALVAVACLASLAGCASEPAARAAPQHVDGGVRMAASGLDGWQFHRVLRFGDYATSPVAPKASGLSADGCLPDCRGGSTVAFGKEQNSVADKSEHRLGLEDAGGDAVGHLFCFRVDLCASGFGLAV